MDTTATVSAVETVGRDTYALRFDAPDGFAAEPGQFVKLGTEIDGESVARFYTLSSPTIDDTFEVTVGIDTDEGGEFLRVPRGCRGGHGDDPLRPVR